MNKEICLAFDVLTKVYVDNAYASIELNKVLNDTKLNNALITKIVYGVIEKDVSLDFIVRQFVSRNPSKEVMLALKTGAYIGLFLKSIPSYALVNEMVNIVKGIDKFSSGFVNATLKNILSGTIKFPSEKDISNYLSIKYSYPKWIIDRFITEFGIDRTKSLVSSKLTTDTHIRVNTKSIPTANFVRLLDANNIRYNKTMFDDTMYVDYSALLKIKADNEYVVQGLPSIITVRNIDYTANMQVLDLCSAPGGKSVLTAFDYDDAQVTACDIYEHRVKLVSDYASHFGLKNIKTMINDATVLNNNFINRYDQVLCDVPCSGLGIVSKKPDILLNRTPEDIDSLNEIQSKILDNASKYVKNNGSIIYSTCSVLPSENEKIVKEFLNKHKEFELEAINTYGTNVINNDNMVTFSPELSGTEGFFIAKIKKVVR